VWSEDAACLSHTLNRKDDSMILPAIHVGFQTVESELEMDLIISFASAPMRYEATQCSDQSEDWASVLGYFHPSCSWRCRCCRLELQAEPLALFRPCLLGRERRQVDA
jgi:hypothetical protein